MLRLLLFYLHYVLLIRKLPEFKFSLNIDSSIFKVLIGFGVWMTVSNLISPLMIVSDRFVISNLLGAVVISFYTVPFEIVSRILVFPAALTNVLFPRFSHLSMCSKIELSRIYRKSYLAVASSMLLICLPIIIFSKFGLQIWLGNEFSEKSWLVASILSIGIFFNGIAMVPFAFVQSQGSSKITAFFHLLELVIYFPVLIVCTKKFNIEGAAFAWTFRVFIDLIVLTFYARKIIKSEQ